MKIVTSLLFLTLAASAYTQSNWVEIYSANSEQLPAKTFYLNQTHVWGINGGAIHFSGDGGKHWDVQYEKPQFNFLDLFFVDEMNGWIVGWSEVLHTWDGGESWEYQSLPNPLGLDVNAVCFINPDTGWIAGSYQTIYVTHNGGENWSVQHQYDLEGHYWLWEIAFWNELYGCAVGGKLTGGDTGIIMNTVDGGANWTISLPEQSDELNAVQFIDQDTIWAGDRGGYLYRSTDAGANWELYTQVNGMGGDHLQDFHFFDHSHAMAILEPWQWAFTEDAWQNYETGIIGLYHRFSHLTFNALNQGMMSGYGNFWLTLDSAETWEYQNVMFSCLDFPEENVGWAGTISPDDKLYHSTSGGVDWESIESPDQSPILCIDFISTDVGYLGTESGLFKTNDGGEEWININLPAAIDSIKKLQAIGSDTIFALAKNNLFMKTYDGGQSWDYTDDFETDYLNDLHFRSGQWGSLVGAYGFTATTQDGGNSWDVTIINVLNPVSVWFINDQKGYCISFYDSVYKTIDGGHNWAPIDKKTFRAVDITFADEYTGWIAEGHQISKTTDGGATWEAEFVLPGTDVYKYIMDLSAVNDQTAYFCTSEGKIYKYDYTTSTGQKDQYRELQCYPNPATNNTEIFYDRPFTGDESVELHLITGESVCSFSFHYKAGKIVLDISRLESGIYIFTIKQKDNKIYTGKLVKQ